MKHTLRPAASAARFTPASLQRKQEGKRHWSCLPASRGLGKCPPGSYVNNITPDRAGRASRQARPACSCLFPDTHRPVCAAMDMLSEGLREKQESARANMQSGCDELTWPAPENGQASEQCLVTCGSRAHCGPYTIPPGTDSAHLSRLEANWVTMMRPLPWCDATRAARFWWT